MELGRQFHKREVQPDLHVSAGRRMWKGAGLASPHNVATLLKPRLGEMCRGTLVGLSHWGPDGCITPVCGWRSVSVVSQLLTIWSQDLRRWEADLGLGREGGWQPGREPVQ